MASGSLRRLTEQHASLGSQSQARRLARDRLQQSKCRERGFKVIGLNLFGSAVRSNLAPPDGGLCLYPCAASITSSIAPKAISSNPGQFVENLNPPPSKLRDVPMKVSGQIAWTTMNSNPATMSSQPARTIVASCSIAQVRRSSKLKARQALKKDVASAEMRCPAPRET